MQVFSLLGKTKGKKEETGIGEGRKTSKGKDAKDHESEQPGMLEVERHVKEEGKNGDKYESKMAKQ